MRIRLDGSYTMVHMLDAMDCIAQSLRLNGVDYVRGVELTLAPYSGLSPLVFHAQSGARVSELRFANRRQNVFEPLSPRITAVAEKDAPAVRAFWKKSILDTA